MNDFAKKRQSIFKTLIKVVSKKKKLFKNVVGTYDDDVNGLSLVLKRKKNRRFTENVLFYSLAAMSRW